MHRFTQHIALYRKPGRYADWPANYCIWSWQEEIVVSFTLGFHDADNGGFHTADRSRPFLTHQRQCAFIVSYEEATAQGDNGAQWHILRAA